MISARTTTRRARRRSLATAALAAVVCLSLTGCFGNPIEDIVERAVGNSGQEIAEGILEGVTGGEGDFEFGEVPDDFPSEAILPDLPVLSAIALREDGGTIWTVNYAVDNAIDFLAEFRKEYDNAGFTETQTVEMEDMAMVFYEGFGYRVHLNALGTEDDSGFSVMVSQDAE